LASVLHLAELHGGQVLVDSQEGVGSTFTLRLALVD
jgi:signal transduction histidine kinase